MKRLFTLILLAILPLLTFAHEIFVVETGQIIQSDTYPTVKITDNEKNENEGYTIMVNYGDGTNSIITTESDRTDYCVDISEKPGIEPGAFFLVTLRQGNQIIQTQKILR